jgi:L,D-transpeptidase catalytic domain
LSSVAALTRTLCLTAGLAALLSTPAAAAPGNRSSNEAQPRVQRVSVPAIYAPGSIVIVNGERKLYYITGRGEALRYGVAVGKNSELWMGRTFVAAKAVDPKWIPINGDDAVEGGEAGNPLGKRAMYLDWSLLRIHGTPSRGSIGSAVSNGCIRMLNEDVIDLFERVHLGAPVYAIKSWKEATKYETVKVAEKIYADPEAHKAAADDLRQQLADRADEQRQERRQQSAAASRQSQTRQSTWSNGPSSNGPSAFPSSWNQRSGLGR